MARPPLPLGSWGKITRTEVSPGRWRARALCRDYDGVTRAVERFDKSGAAAERRLIAAMRDRSAPGDGTITRDSTVEKLAEVWVEQIGEDENHSTNTVRSYTSAARQIVKAMRDVRVGELNAGLVDRYLRSRKSAASERTARTVLAGMVALAVRHGALQHNTVREARRRAAERREVRGLTPEEWAELRSDLAEWVAEDPRRPQDMVELGDVLIGTSRRIGEVLAVRIEDVDVENSQITFCGTIVDGKRQPWPKSKRPIKVTVPEFTMRAVKIQIDRDLPSTDGLLFPSAKGTPRWVNNVERSWRSARGEKWKRVTPHTFRTAGGTAVGHAHGAQVAADYLGNTLKVAEKHYVEDLPEAPDMRKVMERFSPQDSAMVPPETHRK